MMKNVSLTQLVGAIYVVCKKISVFLYYGAAAAAQPASQPAVQLQFPAAVLPQWWWW